MPRAYLILNLVANIYFSLRVLVYNARGVLIQKYTPLYKIPYYYFSTIIEMNSLLILIFFLALYLESNYEYFTYLSE